MLVAKTSVGSNVILIETDDEDVTFTGSKADRQTELTSIPESLGEAYERAKGVILTIATDFANELKAVVASTQKIEIEFALNLSSSTGLWVMTAKGGASLKVKMIWENK